MTMPTERSSEVVMKMTQTTTPNKSLQPTETRDRFFMPHRAAAELNRYTALEREQEKTPTLNTVEILIFHGVN